MSRASIKIVSLSDPIDKQKKKKQKEEVPIRSGSILKCFSNVRSHSRTSAPGFPCCIATLGRFPSIEQPPNSSLRSNSNVDTRLSKTLFSTKHKADREPTNEWIHLFIDRNSAYRKLWNFPVEYNMDFNFYVANINRDLASCGFWTYFNRNQFICRHFFSWIFFNIYWMFFIQIYYKYVIFCMSLYPF